MKILKNIDAYLLRHFPSVWITRVHIFLPIGLTILMLIYLFNVISGWNPKDSIPDGEEFVIFMVIPVIIYLVYWFIFQSRYNVLKSGGKVSILQEYLNLFLYASVFFVAFLFLLAIPLSNNHKISFSVGYDEFKQDVNRLNLGSGIMNGFEAIREDPNGGYSFRESNFVNFWGGDGTSEESADFTIHEKEVNLSRQEVLMRIENYVTSFNKYTQYEIDQSSEEILSEREQGRSVFGWEDYENWDSSVSYKIIRLYDIHVGGSGSFENDPWFWRISVGICFWLALCVWIFKQMNRRHFVLGLISICLTPLAMAILSACFFLLFNDSNVAVMGLSLIILTYVIVGGFVISGFLQNRLNQTAYVLTMYFHFWIILLPFVIYLRYLTTRSEIGYYYLSGKIAGMDEEVFVYWVTFALGMISLVLFKPLYTKFRSLPMNK